MTITFTVVTDDQGFRSLEPSWRALTAKLDPSHFYQDFDWCWRAWQHLASRQSRSLRVLVGSAEGRVVLILPLMIGGPYLRLLGSEFGEFCDVAVEPAPQRAAWVAAAMRAARRLGGQSMLLRHVQADADLFRFLSSRRIAGLSDESDRHYVLRLDRFAAWDDYLATLPPRTVADQRRYWRGLGKKASVSFDVLQSWPDMQAAIAWQLARKVEWLRSRDLSAALFGSPHYADFLIGVSYDMHLRNMTFVSRLTADGAFVAALLGFKHNSHFVFQMFAFDPAWRKFAPGRLVMERTLQWCHRHGFASVDFLMGDPGFKTMWTNEQTVLRSYLLPITVQGHAIAACHRWNLRRVMGRTWFRTSSRLVPSAIRSKIRNRVESNASTIKPMRPIRWQR